MPTAAPSPFRVDVSDECLARIQARLADTRFTYAPLDDADWQYGTDLGYLRDFVACWRDSYDWRDAERELNRHDQFTCVVDGIDIHFLHLRAPDASPRRTLLLTHGWPGSTTEFHAAAARLVERFDLVIPSLPGYGFSGRPDRPLGPRQVAELWRRLMVEGLGITRFGVQGGDWGSAVSAWLANDAPLHVAGLHLNLCMPPATREPDALEAGWRAELSRVMQVHSAYMMEQMTRPQTIALALADNPVGYAAWVLEKFHGWGDIGGDIERRFSKHWLITNLMIHLVNDATTSMIWLYRGALEEALAGRHQDMKVEVPTAFARFPAEFLPPPPRAVAERSFNIVRWTEMAAGGHFAALEEPDAFAADVDAFFSEVDFT